MISIILPTRNRAAWLQETVESVLRQTYQNFELIVIDDGSQDETENVIQPYRHRLRYIVQEHRGVASARNRGLNEARGDYVAFIDDDDRWLPHKLELQARCVAKHPEIGFLFSDFMAFNNDGNISRSYIRTYFMVLDRHRLSYDRIFSGQEPVKGFTGPDFPWSDATLYTGRIFETLLLGNFVLTSTVLAKRSAVLDIGGFRESLQVAEDADLYLRLSQREEAGFIDKTTIQYRLSQKQISSNEDLIWKSNLHSLESIISNDTEIGELHRARIQNRFSYIYRMLALLAFKEERMSDARDYWGKSVAHDPLQWQPYLGWSASWVPARLIRLARSLRRQVLRRGSPRSPLLH